jgi:hypothetical protein
MTRQDTIQAITRHLQQMDTGALEGLLKLLEHQGHSLSAAGLPYTGNPETDAVLDEHPDILERVKRLERGESTVIPWEQVKARQRAKREVK